MHGTQLPFWKKPFSFQLFIDKDRSEYLLNTSIVEHYNIYLGCAHNLLVIPLCNTTIYIIVEHAFQN